jgi:hypothetical protein
MKRNIYFILISLFIASGYLFSQKAEKKSWIDTVKAGTYDNGKMWTFDYPPTDYFKSTYNFSPDKDWFESARLSAIRLPNCSASFVSEDGLIMTNHHCAREPLDRVNRPGENLPEDGFYAPTMKEERKVPGLFVDQLVLIEDVTKEIQAAYDNGKTDEEKIKNRTDKIAELEKQSKEKTGYNCKVMTFYNGGKYSLYGYKRYSDIRIVFAVETNTGFYGGDYDNFTYPRYDLDCSFFRAYDENGKPLKPKHFFKFSKNSVKEGDLVFIIGNPGRTSRLLSYSQLEFDRDYQYPMTLSLLNGLVDIFSGILAKHPDRKLELETQLFSFSNSQKAYAGMLGGLLDPYLMAKKKDFEKKFKDAVMANPELKAKYATMWDDIASYQKEKSKTFGIVNSLNFRGGSRMPGRSPLFGAAYDLVDFAKQVKLPEEQRKPQYKSASLDSVKSLISAAKITDKEIGVEILALHLSMIKTGMEGDETLKLLLQDKSCKDQAASIMASTVLLDADKVKALLNGNPDDILKSNDPIISFVAANYDKSIDARKAFMKALEKETVKVESLGKALYDVYGTKLPPDAQFTLRIADGVVKGYEYNGTIAPPITTFYGLYDRYYSFNKQFPYELTEKWKNPPASFKMNTPFNFVATADIIGGNSGSPVINKNQEIVGLVFDGNIESLPGDFIFEEVKNRAVSVTSSGIMEALENIYQAERLVKELKAGKIVE